jgi:hypothetical protein
MVPDMMRALAILCVLFLAMPAAAKKHKPRRQKARATRVVPKKQRMLAKAEAKPRPEAAPPVAPAPRPTTVASASRAPMVEQVWDDEVPGRPRK